MCLIGLFVAKTTGRCLEDVEQMFYGLSGSLLRRSLEEVRRTSERLLSLVDLVLFVVKSINSIIVESVTSMSVSR